MRKLQGNAGKRALRTGEPKPQPMELTPPAWLLGGRRAEAFYRHWAKLLGPRLQIAGESDRLAFAAMVQEWTAYLDVCDVLKVQGLIISTRFGDKPHPLLAEKDRAFKRWAQLAGQFGMTPSSRAKVSAMETAADDPFDVWAAGVKTP